MKKGINFLLTPQLHSTRFWNEIGMEGLGCVLGRSFCIAEGLYCRFHESKEWNSSQPLTRRAALGPEFVFLPAKWWWS